MSKLPSTITDQHEVLHYYASKLYDDLQNSALRHQQEIIDLFVAWPSIIRALEYGESEVGRLNLLDFNTAEIWMAMLCELAHKKLCERLGVPRKAELHEQIEQGLLEERSAYTAAIRVVFNRICAALGHQEPSGCSFLLHKYGHYFQKIYMHNL